MSGSFFDKAKNFSGDKAKTGEREERDFVRVTSNFGREITSVRSAKELFYKKSERVNPIPFINEAVANNSVFCGLKHGDDEDGKPLFISENDITMSLYVGSTGTGKGIKIGNDAVEAMKKKKGLIIVDPKQDDFLPQIILEELTRQGRVEDFQVCSFPDNFGYQGINEFDTYKDVANKFIDALDLTPTDNAGVDYYRKNGRIMLNKVLKLFFDGSLGVIVKKDFKDILFHLQMLKEDMEKQVLLEKEIGKMKPNANLIEKYEKRFYDLKKIEAVYWDSTAVETLDSLVKSVSEISDSADIFKKYDLQGALYDGKVLYLKVDMLDVASLKMVKMMITDAIQQARRKKANCVIIADELSFYVTKTLRGALATVRGFGLRFTLALQSLGQFGDQETREDIMDNCNLKLFYKPSSESSLKYIPLVGGEETITSYSTGADGDYKISQKTEMNLNVTRLRALPRAGVAVVIAEELNEPIVVRTNFVATEGGKVFDWAKYNKREETGYFDGVQATSVNLNGESDYDKIERYKVSMSIENLLENSDIFGVKFTSEEI